MLHLRPLNDTDIAAIALWPAYRGDMAQMDYALRESGWLAECRARADVRLYAVESDGELIAFSLLARTGPEEAEFRIALRADKTGLGLGGTITVQTLERGFYELGIARIHLIVRKNNNRGIGLYRRIGFTECGECRKDINGEPVDFWLMEIGAGEFGALHGAHARGKEAVMPDKTRRALVVIDVQNDYIGGNLPLEFPPVELSLANIGRAMDAANEAGIPVIVIHNILPETAPFMAKGTPGADLHEVVASRSRDHYVAKNMPSAFAGTGLETWLRERSIDTVTIVGYMSHNCDLSTALHAMHAGFAVEFLSDATGSLPYANRAGSATAEEIHRVVCVVLQSRFAAVMSTAEWLDAIATGTPPERDTIFASNRRARLAPR